MKITFNLSNRREQMLNTTYKELKDLCVEYNITNIKALAAFLDYPASSLYKTVDRLNKDKKLFTEVKQELFKKSDWWDNDYEFMPDERLEDMSHLVDNLFVTDYGTVLTKVTTKRYDKLFSKFVEVKKIMINERVFVQKKNGKQPHPVRFTVDRLVAEAFIDKNIKGKIVTNRSDNAFDNYYKNLQIV